jgi:hypothetical protein
MVRAMRAWVLAIAVLSGSAFAASDQAAPSRTLSLPIRGMTIGPIENAIHPGRGYGSDAYGRALDESRRMGATWVALTPFGRVANLKGRGIDLTFERPFDDNRRDLARACDMAHERGLRVMLVPHLWVESGEWRALIDPGTNEGWAEWEKSYTAFARTWAEVAQASQVDLFSCGVELRSWVTSGRAPGFSRVIREVRKAYHGPITYSANWDDVDDTVILGELDIIGINAFYPLAASDGAPFSALLEGGKRVAERVRSLSQTWNKSILFTEIGYTTRPNPAIKPWEWPDHMKHVRVDQRAQAEAYSALIAPQLDEPAFAGFFVWRTYSDPDDVSQEAEWGFSPRGKLAELVLRDAFSSRWATDIDRVWWHAPRARVAGIFP